MQPTLKQRMHSGEHIFIKSLIKQNQNVKVEKVELDEKESKVFISSDKLDWNTIFKAESLANKIIKDGREIIIKEVSKEEASKITDLRARFDRIKSDKVRIVEIKDFDLSSCTGEHCSNTSEIGSFFVTGFNSLGNQRYEIRFMVDSQEELFYQSKKFREILALLNTDKENIIEAIKILKGGNKKLTEQIRELQKDQPLKVNEEKIGSINFVSGTFENFEKLILMRKINEYIRKKTVACFLNTAEKGTYIIIAASEDSGKNANELLQSLLKEFNGKGGGKNNFASGFVEEKYKKKVFPKLKELL